MRLNAAVSRLVGLAGLVVVPSFVAAQSPRLIGSPAEDRARVADLLHPDSTDWLIRSPSSNDTSRNRRAIDWVWPVVDGYDNSALPFGLNTGTLWAGRGTSERLTAGLRVDLNALHFQLIPEVTRSANLGFAIVPDSVATASGFSSPFYTDSRSIDLPVRFGAQATTRFAPGQSALWVSAGPIDAGLSTESQWWGPAIQNALIMSNNAEGIPSAFVRTRKPLHTSFGTFNAKAVLGELTESLYFDNDPSNDRRSISGVVATYSPPMEPNASIGFSRVVYANLPPGSQVAGHALDAVTQWSTTRGDSAAQHGVDQLYSLFARWVFPRSGVEVYGEFARILPPVSIRDWLVAPQYSGGFTIGAQVAHPLSNGAAIRVQTEITNLEQVVPSLAADTLTFYASRAVPQGYTERGKAIGAAIGPGGSSQMLAADYMARRWDVGLYAERIRWNNDVYFVQPVGVGPFAQDVTVLGGIRGGVRFGRSEVHAEYSISTRYNFEFQNARGGFGQGGENDFRNRTLRLWIAP